MALDPQEFQKRRLERAQKRQRQSKQLRLRLIAAGVVLVLVAVLIVVLTRRAPTQQPGATQVPTEQTRPTDTQTDATEAPAESVPEETEPTTVIQMACVGDLNVTDLTVAPGERLDGYTEAFLDVAHLLADADVTAVNFEGSLYGVPYGTEEASAPQALMDSLARAGVDFVQLANSYSIRHGMLGLDATIRGVRAAGMAPLGVSSAQTGDQGYVIREVGGIRIAFVAFTKGMDGMALPAGSEGSVNVLYEDYDRTYQNVDTEGITRVLRQVAREEPELTVALLHWGSEYNNTISATQQEICSLMLAEGVDAIIGTHSHYVQKMELDPENGTFVAYSLGDFYGDADRAGSQYSVVLQLEITRDNATGKTAVTSFDYVPIYLYAREGQPLRVLRIREAMAAYEAEYIERVDRAAYEDMQYSLERIEARIAGE